MSQPTYTMQIVGCEPDAFVLDGSGQRRLRPRYDLRNHSPDGFAWGYGGSGPAQLALALCADALQDDRRAVRIYQAFKFRVVARHPMDQPWSITRAEIFDAVADLERARSA